MKKNSKPEAKKQRKPIVEEEDNWLDDEEGDSERNESEDESESNIEEEKTGDRQILYQILNVPPTATQEEIVIIYSIVNAKTTRKL